MLEKCIRDSHVPVAHPYVHASTYMCFCIIAFSSIIDFLKDQFQINNRDAPHQKARVDVVIKCPRGCVHFYTQMAMCFYKFADIWAFCVLPKIYY